MNQLSEEQIVQLSPDPASLKAGKDLSNEKKWVSFGFNDRVLWGEVQGSGKDPYRTQIDLNNTAFKCSCPSRKFPCKHGLGLYILFARKFEIFVKTETEPDWVKDWIEKRETKAEKAVESKNQETDPEKADKQEKSKQKSQQKRFEEMSGGVAELDRWLKDLVRSGLLATAEKDSQFWQKTAARMVDAKSPGLGNLVKEFEEINFYNGNEWQSEVLQQSGKIYLLIEAYKNIEKLPELWQEDIKNLIGVSKKKEDLLQDTNTESIKDSWIVLSRQRETNDDLTIQRDWLYGYQSKRFALILNFAFKNQPIQSLLVPGTATQAELVFYPSNYPLRAIVKLQGTNSTDLLVPEMSPFWRSAQEIYTDIISRYPWADTVPIFISELTLVLNQNHWFLKDSEERFMEVNKKLDEEKIFQLLALSGGLAMDYALLRTENSVTPIGVWINKKYRVI